MILDTEQDRQMLLGALQEVNFVGVRQEVIQQMKLIDELLTKIASAVIATQATQEDNG